MERVLTNKGFTTLFFESERIMEMTEKEIQELDSEMRKDHARTIEIRLKQLRK